LVDTHLKGRKFFVGEAVTIADLAIYTTLVYAYRSYFDENFRNAHSGLTAWFESVAQHPNVQKYYGKTHYSSKPWF
jgi:elongation factor 1-gamma